MKSLFTFTLALIFTTASAFAADQTTTLAVPDMNCAVCPITVKKVLLKVEGVKAVQVDLDSRKATVNFDNAKTNVAALIHATTEAGYPSSLLEARK